MDHHSESRPDLEKLREAVARGRIQWKQHALKRMFERGIERGAVKHAIADGEGIEYYEHDSPLPRYLIYHAGHNPLHVVVAYDADNDYGYVITAYVPDNEHFEADLKTRRRL